MLEREEVAIHPFVVGELACSGLRKRKEGLDLLAALPAGSVASDDEALAFIERRRLYGKGIGYVDAHLLAAVALSDGMRLWTRDKRLAAGHHHEPGHEDAA